MAIRKARIHTESVTILCPHCAVEQPSPYNGSLFWTSDELATAAANGATTIHCVDCGKGMVILPETKVRFA